MFVIVSVHHYISLGIYYKCHYDELLFLGIPERLKGSIVDLRF